MDQFYLWHLINSGQHYFIIELSFEDDRVLPYFILVGSHLLSSYVSVFCIVPEVLVQLRKGERRKSLKRYTS